MYRGYTVKLYPNKAQAQMLERHFGCSRWVYNEMIRINQKAYHRRGQSLSSYDMSSYLPKLKKQYPWLAEATAQSLQVVCHNLADAYGRFFKKQAGYPAFKRKGEAESFTCIDNSRFEGNRLRLPKLGLIRYRGGVMPEGKVNRFTVRKTATGYFASALIDDGKDAVALRDPGNILGLDLGLIDLIVTSAGERVKAPKHFAEVQADLRRRQQALSRKHKGSARRAKAKRAVAVLHAKARNRRKDFQHKLTRRLVDGESQAFAVEALNVKGMMSNGKLAKHIADCGWRQFLMFLRYKAAAHGKPVLEVGRFYPSSKTCSACGVVLRSLPLSVREWQCDDCGSIHQRDVNAALNIALEAARNAASERGDGVSPAVLRPVPVAEARTRMAGSSGNARFRGQ